jgi:hypothetical protein
MPITNLNADHFEVEDRDLINEAWLTIMSVLNTKTRNLTPEERKKYGSIKEENKLVVQKILDYDQNQPHLNSPDVNYKELRADWEDRMFLSGFLSRMEEASNICNNVHITHDYDAFQNARVDYKHCKYKMETAPGAGFESKYKDLLQFFKTYTEPSEGKVDEVPGDAPEA